MFYVITISVSTLLNIKQNMSGWITYTSVVYSLMFYLILTYTVTECNILIGQVRKLSIYANHMAVLPLKQKHTTYNIFLLLVLLILVVEVVCEALFALDVFVYYIIVLFEATQLGILFTIGE